MTSGGNCTMANRTAILRSSLLALLVLFGVTGTGPAFASDPPGSPIEVNGKENGLRFVPLGVGKSVVIDLPRDAKDVLVADPAIANAVVRSTRRAYLIGVKVGQTNVFFFDAEGRQIAGFDIAVTRDLNGIRAALRQMLPGADIRVEGSWRGRRTERDGGEPGRIPAGLRPRGPPGRRHQQGRQRPHHQRSRSGDAQSHGRGSAARHHQATRHRSQRQPRLRQLGVELQHRKSVFGVGSARSAIPTSLRGWVNGGNRITATLQAMERAGVIRTLAEPNLTAISGESATFLAGGEFPIPPARTCDANGINLPDHDQFKKFGIGLNFTPVVLSEGRISLKVATEVSELSQEGALVQAGLVDPVAARAPRRHDGRNSVGRRARDGRPDPGADQAGDQRRSRTAAGSDPRHAVQEPRLRQSAKRTGGAGDALSSCAPSRRRNCRGRTTASPTRPIRIPSCWASSIASMARPARSIRDGPYHGKYGFILD